MTFISKQVKSTNMEEIQKSNDNQIAYTNTVSTRPNTDSRLFAVLSHVTFGIMGILILVGAVKIAKGNKFILRHAITSIFNSIVAILAVIVWVLANMVISKFTGFMIISDFYMYGIVGLIIFFYFTAFIASIGAAKGKESRIPWAYPIAKAIIK